MKRLFKFNPTLFLLIHSGTGSPYALSLNLRKMWWLASIMGSTILVCFCGSLLFFRELELNRNLQESVLALQIKEKLAKRSTIALPETAAPNSVPMTMEMPANPAAFQKSSETEMTLPAAAVGKNTTSSDFVEPRISELTTERKGDFFLVNLSLVPTATGTAQGQLVVILESEIPRIGARNPNTTMRKRFFIYPGYLTKDELNQNELPSLERKTFEFSRVLQTNVRFTIGKLMRPLALNIYLFDQNKNLIQHERKVIETME